MFSLAFVTGSASQGSVMSRSGACPSADHSQALTVPELTIPCPTASICPSAHLLTLEGGKNPVGSLLCSVSLPGGITLWTGVITALHLFFVIGCALFLCALTVNNNEMR